MIELDTVFATVCSEGSIAINRLTNELCVDDPSLRLELAPETMPNGDAMTDLWLVEQKCLRCARQATTALETLMTFTHKLEVTTKCVLSRMRGLCASISKLFVHEQQRVFEENSAIMIQLVKIVEALDSQDTAVEGNADRNSDDRCTATPSDEHERESGELHSDERHERWLQTWRYGKKRSVSSGLSDEVHVSDVVGTLYRFFCIRHVLYLTPCAGPTRTRSSCSTARCFRSQAICAALR
jgi:hypothetical protein